MVRVQARVKCFVDNSIRQKGEVFEYSGDEVNERGPLILVGEDDLPVVKPRKRRRIAPPAEKLANPEE